MEAAYCGPPPLPDHILTSFNFDPILMLALLAAAVALRRSPAGLGAVAVLAIAFVSPLCALSSALFGARVVHHVLLVAIAAPLLALSFPTWRPDRIVLPFVVATVALWAWHIPAAYDLALVNVGIYWAMQLTLLGSAIWFWRAVLARDRSPVDQLVFIGAAFAQMGLLGAILTFATTPLYAAHAVAPYAWGMTPLEDQALGGLVMWVPAGIPYAVAALLITRRAWTRLTGVAA